MGSLSQNGLIANCIFSFSEISCHLPKRSRITITTSGFFVRRVELDPIVQQQLSTLQALSRSLFLASSPSCLTLSSMLSLSRFLLSGEAMPVCILKGPSLMSSSFASAPLGLAAGAQVKAFLPYLEPMPLSIVPWRHIEACHRCAFFCGRLLLVSSLLKPLEAAEGELFHPSGCHGSIQTVKKLNPTPYAKSVLRICPASFN